MCIFSLRIFESEHSHVNMECEGTDTTETEIVQVYESLIDEYVDSPFAVINKVQLAIGFNQARSFSIEITKPYTIKGSMEWREREHHHVHFSNAQVHDIDE